MRNVSFYPLAFEQFTEWATEDRKIYRKIVRLIKEAQRDPFAGTGQPEPLRHDLAGYWSRRITKEHRLVYKATDDTIVIASCKHHYGK